MVEPIISGLLPTLAKGCPHYKVTAVGLWVYNAVLLQSARSLGCHQSNRHLHNVGRSDRAGSLPGLKPNLVQKL